MCVHVCAHCLCVNVCLYVCVCVCVCSALTCCLSETDMTRKQWLLLAFIWSWHLVRHTHTATHLHKDLYVTHTFTSLHVHLDNKTSNHIQRINKNTQSLIQNGLQSHNFSTKITLPVWVWIHRGYMWTAFAICESNNSTSHAKPTADDFTVLQCAASKAERDKRFLFKLLLKRVRSENWNIFYDSRLPTNLRYRL